METEREESRSSEFWKELLKLLLLSVLIVVPFRLFIAQPFIVDGASMDPTFKNSEYLIVDEVSYRFQEPERGSVIVFKYPKDPSKYFIKRIIGLPQETVIIREGETMIISKDYPDGLVLNEPYIEFEKSESLSFILGEDEYFVMGDNRAGSADSRAWGAVPRENFIGRPILRLFPPSVFPGDERDLFKN